MKDTQVKIGDWLQAGFELYKENFGLLVLVNLVALVISALTAGILAGPMMAGVTLVTLAVLDGKEALVGDVFKGFEVFLPSFLYAIGLMLVSLLAGLLFPGLSMIAYAIVLSLTIFTIFFIIEDRMECWPAVVRSYNIVKANFWPFFALVLVAGIIQSLGFALCCIGGIFTTPFFYCVLAIAYRAHFPHSSVDTENTVEVGRPTDEELKQSAKQPPESDETNDEPEDKNSE